MERSRAWPWKKKITEKLASAALELKQGNERLDNRIDLKDQAPGLTPLQQAEAKLRILTEQLAVKDEVVLQHAKVAEEAVSGWEKAESETANVRELLDAESQKRLAMEDRVAHLDGALKECMRQLRHVREQQEQKIHEAILKKTRDWEEVQGEMEAKMAKLTNELLEVEAEKVVMTKSLQERAKAIMEAKEGRSNAEEKIKLLQVKLEAAEKDQTKWKYELHILSKELQIRNEEIEFNKKASDAANKQHLDDVKKVAKLETECQRLRLLVRRKLPGPAAISQMRMEVEALGIVPSMSVERSRRMLSSHRSKGNGWKPDRGESSWTVNGVADEDQLLTMEDENKALKEALSRSNSDLEAVRMLYACTASKLSSVEEQLENASSASSYNGLPRVKLTALDGYMSSSPLERNEEPSIASVSEDGAPEIESSGAESWATTLISDFSQFSKEKGATIGSAMLDSSRELMDDFAEMEKLASMLPDSLASPAGETPEGKHMGNDGTQPSLFADLPSSDDKMQSLCKHSDDLQLKLRGVECELNVARLQRLSARAALSSLEKRLVALLQSGESSSLTDALEEVRAALKDSKHTESKSSLAMAACSERACVEMETAEVRDTRVWSPSDLSSCQSEESTCKQEIPQATMKVGTVGKELVIAMHKVACLIDSLSHIDFDLITSETHVEADRNDSLGPADASKQWKSSELTTCIQSMVTLCNGALHGHPKVEMMDFLVEIASALDWLMSHLFSTPSMISETSTTRRRLGLDNGSISPHDSRITNVASSPSYDISVDTLLIKPGVLYLNGEENHSGSLDVQRKKTHDLAEQLNQLKTEKDEGDEKLKKLASELEAMRSQLEDTRSNASHLEAALRSAMESKGSLTADVTELVSTKRSLERELLEAKDEIKKLEERARSLEVQVQDETQCRKDIEAMYHDLLGRTTVEKKQAGGTCEESNLGEMALEEEAAKTRKEQEIAAAAEKLAECQQTILALGKQLKDLGLPTNAGGESPAVRLPSYKSPMSEHRSHSMCDQLPSAYGKGFDSAGTSPIGFHPPIGEEDSSSLSDDRTRTSSLHGSLRGHNDGRHGGLSYGGYTDTSHVGTSCEALLSPDRSTRALSRGHGLVSPDFSEPLLSRRTALVPARDLALISPGRSPARFLGLKRRGDTNKPEAPSPSSEKHANGFTRFFSRNKGSK